MIYQSIWPRRSVTIIALFILVTLSCTTGAAFAQTVHVDSKAAGYFGAYARTVDEASLDLVEAYVFSNPGAITLTVNGNVDLHPDYAKFRGVGPNGITFQRGTTGCHMPLEEGLVDAKGYGSVGARMERAGAVFGAFVPKSIVDKPGFRPINEDIPSGGISSDRLFFVGERLDFSAHQPGTLFLGVNDCRPYNNSGSFYVSIMEK